MDDLRVGGEEPKRARAEEAEQDSHDDCVEVAEPQKAFKALLHTVELPGPHVLSDVGGRGQGQAVGREQSKAVYLPVNVAASHGQGTEAVQIALYNDIGQGGDGGLKPGGNAEF